MSRRDEAETDARAHFNHLHQHLGTTLGVDLSYRELVKYVQGFDDATDFLDGFHGWLVSRLNGGRSIYWSALVQFDALDVAPVHHSTDLPVDWVERVQRSDSELVQHLFRLVDEFLLEQGPRVSE